MYRRYLNSAPRSHLLLIGNVIVTAVGEVAREAMSEENGEILLTSVSPQIQSLQAGEAALLYDLLGYPLKVIVAEIDLRKPRARRKRD